MENVTEQQDDRVSPEDTILLEWTEHAVRSMPPSAETVALVERTLTLLKDKYPELVRLQVVGADQVEGVLCADPECDNCNGIRRMVEALQRVADPAPPPAGTRTH